MFDRHLKSGRFRLEDQKHAAWAFVVGERPRKAADDSRRRPHRGMLPDVDFDRAVPDPGHRSLLSRIADFLWGDRRGSTAQPDAEAELRATLTAALGERLAAAYIGKTRPILERDRRRCDSRVARDFDKAGRRFDTHRSPRAPHRSGARLTSIECHDNVPLV